MTLDDSRSRRWTVGYRTLLVLLVATLSLILTPWLTEPLFRARELIHSQSDRQLTPRPDRAAARLVRLEAGGKLTAQSPPAGWSHVVMKSVPNLASGDLDTVSDQAFMIARRIRPLILADVRRSGVDTGAGYNLERVGVGLCAPAEDGKSDRIVTATTVDGTAGEWTAKQRLILTALAYETSRTRLLAATPTFALLRSPCTFLIGGSHLKVGSYYAVLADPASGQLRVLVWQSGHRRNDEPRPELSAHLLESPEFDCPQDVHATRVLGTPVAWSFAIREIPPGPRVTLPVSLAAAVDESVDGSPDPEALEEAFRQLLDDRP